LADVRKRIGLFLQCYIRARRRVFRNSSAFRGVLMLPLHFKSERSILSCTHKIFYQAPFSILDVENLMETKLAFVNSEKTSLMNSLRVANVKLQIS